MFVGSKPAVNACSPNPASYLNAVNRFTGGSTERQILDINNDGIVDDSDYGQEEVVVQKEFAGIATRLIVAETSQADLSNTLYLAGGLLSVEPIATVSENNPALPTENVPFVPYWAYGLLALVLTMFGAKGLVRD